jgi:hypothetical protein
VKAVTAMSRAEPGSAGPVKAVSVISTGTVRIRPEHRRRLAESSRKVLALAGQHPGLVVLPAHDPTAAQRLLDS